MEATTTLLERARSNMPSAPPSSCPKMRLMGRFPRSTEQINRGTSGPVFYFEADLGSRGPAGRNPHSTDAAPPETRQPGAIKTLRGWQLKQNSRVTPLKWLAGSVHLWDFAQCNCADSDVTDLSIGVPFTVQMVGTAQKESFRPVTRCVTR